MSRYVHITSLMFLFLELVTCQLPSSQNSIMNRLYELLYNSSSGSSFPWNPTNNPNPCSWYGVSCSPPNNSSITHLSLSSFSVSNSDSLALICQIDTLQSLDLSNNHFTSIPDGFISGCGEIVGFKVLNFSRNKLVGSLPNFRGFDSLEILDFSHNSLSGAIDLQLQGLNGLKSLNLSANLFNGSIPINLGRSMALEELQLSRNSFQGNIPEGIANYENLTLIDFGANKLSGSIPENFGELSKLQLLILSLNDLSGEIPNSLSRITTLSRFAANQNRFTGVIPPQIATYLRNLDLSYNSLNGSIPVDFLSGSNLQTVDLSFNSLEGSIPANLSANLVRLRLGSNKLSGRIPSSSLGVLQNLTYLEVDNNELFGTIPPELSLCINLTLLDLSHNNLTGLIPVELGNISNLHVLNLQQNNLVGEIPIQITQLQKLERLNISWNSLNGSIPLSISSLQGLQNLNLQGNNLTGSIPNSIGGLNSLLELQLGSNQLSGVVVALPLNLQIVLNLSHNNFVGHIPDSVSKLTGLEVLDLSDNRFSGSIPDFLARMPSLTQLILSNNQLSGVVPKFESYVSVVTRGNDYLIYPSPTPPPPSRTARKRRSVSVGVIVAAAAAVITVGIVSLIALLVSRRMYRVNDEHLHTEDHSPPPPHVIKGSLLTGNAIHRSNIDFTKAMEAVAQPSNIVLRTRFTTYYKAVMPSGLSYFVKKINWSDKIFQLGSHDRFEEELEVIGKLNNSNVMTPLAYILTVDSAYLLYEFAEKGTLFDVLHGSLGDVLDWTSRYSIAIGVAQALAFLHGSTSSPILLLDLSSKIILLKSLKEPQVGDVELCKVIDPSKNTGSISTIAGSVGYIPPEYAYTMRVTMAGNVYSFGVILLELLTGKAAVSEGIELAKWALSKSAQQDKWNSILNFSMSRTSPAIRGQMLAVLRVALACVCVSPDARPNMKSVLRMLLNAR